ncbi:hypothetical protein Glove_52g38 [Diversispora epigaea]|uniref:Uncharacterized protein n=1 Tax=Diversispora epigaea TaxID=1348612 RepID=A0A397JGG3_9GLOM|nr:hypothetical protein Glove_52g38 [Diversispora epigaea]
MDHSTGLMLILRIIIKLEKGNLRCKTFIRGIKNSRGGKNLTFNRIYESYYSKSHRRVESVDEVYELLSQEVSRLQELYVKCAKIYRWMLERRALIGPTTFFQSSFRLLEENEENLVGPI